MAVFETNIRELEQAAAMAKSAHEILRRQWDATLVELGRAEGEDVRQAEWACSDAHRLMGAAFNAWNSIQSHLETQREAAEA